MSKLKTLAKKLLSKDIRTLVKAKYLNDDLTVSDRGRAALDAIAVEREMDALVKMAEDRIEEDREDAGCAK